MAEYKVDMMHGSVGRLPHGWIEGLLISIIDWADNGCDKGWLGSWEPVWLDG